MATGYAVNPSYQLRRAVSPGTVTIEWTTGGTTYSLTDDGNGGLTGNGSGIIAYYSGDVSFRPNPLPTPADGDYQITYNEWGGTSKKTDSVTPTQAEITHTFADGTINSGSLVVTATMVRIKESLDYREYRSDATGDEARKYTLQAVAHDDGAGNLKRDGEIVGSINYSTGSVTFDMRQSYNYEELEQSQSTRTWRAGGKSATEEYDTTVDVAFEYTLPSDPDSGQSKTIPIPGVLMDLLPGSPNPIIPGSVVFDFAGKRYQDRAGSIITDFDVQTDAGTSVGSIDYSTGVVELTEFPGGIDLSQQVDIVSCLTWKGERTSYYSKFRTAGAPLREASLILNAVAEDGTEVSVQANTDGSITDPLIVSGYVDTVTGLVDIEWSQAVFPTSVKYSAVAYSYLPLDPDLLGLDPTRLPSDGRVPVVLPGDVAVFSHTIETDAGTPTAGATLTFTRDHQAEVWAKGANGLTLDPAQYTVDREAGTLIWADPLTLEDDEASALTTPITVYDRVEDMVLVTDVQVSGQVGFNSELSQTYPAGEAIISTGVLHGDLRSRVYNLFHQASWSGDWSDEPIGNDTTAKYNNVAYPIEITNEGSIQERWLIRFLSSTSYEVVGETVGVIGTGNTTEDLAIPNPATGEPYFVMRAGGWGTGWNAGNCVRFNTDGAQAPFWIARTILSGPATESEDSFTTQNRGDAD